MKSKTLVYGAGAITLILVSFFFSHDSILVFDSCNIPIDIRCCIDRQAFSNTNQFFCCANFGWKWLYLLFSLFHRRSSHIRLTFLVLS